LGHRILEGRLTPEIIVKVRSQSPRAVLKELKTRGDWIR